MAVWNKDAYKEVYKKKQQYLLLGALAFLGIVLLILGNQGKQETNQITVLPDTAQHTTIQEYPAGAHTAALEQRLAHTLSQIQGAGAVTVQVTVKSTGRKEYAVDTQYTSRTAIEDNGDSKQQTTEVQEQQTVVQQNKNGAQQALLLEETMPEITGVLIVASGAADAVVAEQLTRAVEALLQVPMHQIIVLPGEEYM